MSITYQQAGVNIDAGAEAVQRIKDKVQATFSPAVLSPLGGFSGLVDLSIIAKNYRQPVLVQSVDGVGTKLTLAKMMDKYDTIGIDIVSNCCGDILTVGARPVTFLDYVASDILKPEVIEIMIAGLAQACRDNGISLIGGETAEMPGVYCRGEHDLVGCITGIVEKDKIITGQTIKPGDLILGVNSSGLHTNGYSLARKIFFEIGGYSVNAFIPKLAGTVGEILLKPHLNYTKLILTLISAGINLKGLAHITGGGLLDNLPRILPEHTAVEIKTGTWPIPPVFTVMQELGQVESQEMYRTFNMGIGMVLIVSPDETTRVRETLKHHPSLKIYEIGQVITGPKKVHINL